MKRLVAVFLLLVGSLFGATPRTFNVRAGDNLQAVIDAAELGDTINVQAGATFEGNFKLPIKTGNQYLIIQSSALASLTFDKRVRPSDAVYMPKIVVSQTTNLPALMPYKSAHHYKFLGIEFIARNPTTSGTYNIIQMGYGANALYSDALWKWGAVTSTTDLPHHITIGRCYIHGDNVKPKFTRCGVMINGNDHQVSNSYISGITDTADAQAIWIPSAGQRIKLLNNYLESSGENIMLGAALNIAGEVPTDITITGNYLYKLKAWDGLWVIKNGFEIKAGRNVTFSGNIVENIFKNMSGQSATAIVLTVRNQSGTSPWAVMENITIRDNLIASCGYGFRVTGEDDLQPSMQTRNVVIENNAVTDVNQAYGASGGLGLSSINLPISEMTFRHNLILHNGIGSNVTFLTAPFTVSTSRAVENLIYDSNILTLANYGVFGNGVGSGVVAFNRYAQTWTAGGNVFVNRPVDLSYTSLKNKTAGGYITGNYLADDIAGVGFEDVAAGNYRLSASSPYRLKGADGKDPGPDWSVLNQAISKTRVGR